MTMAISNASVNGDPETYIEMRLRERLQVTSLCRWPMSFEAIKASFGVIPGYERWLSETLRRHAVQDDDGRWTFVSEVAAR